MSNEQEKAEDAVAQVIVAAIKAARELHPEATGEALDLMARLLLMRGAIVLKEPKAA